MRSFPLTSVLLAALAAPSFAAETEVVINEVDADQTGTDSVEFLELFGTPNASLDDHFLVFYNGDNATDNAYEVIDLDGQTIPADGYFVVGVATVANVDFTPSVLPATNAIQNGEDAIALWFDGSGTLVASDWFGTNPSSAPAGASLVDAVVYDTNDPDDAALLSALSITGPQVNEDDGGAKDTESIGRCPDGGTALDTNSYTTGLPTPGAANTCPTANAWTDLGSALGGVSGDPLLTGTGDLSDGSSNNVDLTNAAPSAFSGLFIGIDPNTGAAFKGGFLVPVPTFKVFFANTNGSGEILLPCIWPAGAPSGFNVYVQWAITDAAAVAGVALSNALVGTTP